MVRQGEHHLTLFMRFTTCMWYCVANRKALDGTAKRKYFEHAGGLLTADGTGDDLIKLEGVPQGKKFAWDDDDDVDRTAAAPATTAAPAATALEPEPDDVCPAREDLTARDTEGGNNVIDSSDDEDDADAPPAPRAAPDGFRFVDEPPHADALTPKHPAQLTLVGRSLLYCWESVGWCVGVITEANLDKRRKVESEMVNFFVHYEIDDNARELVLAHAQPEVVPAHAQHDG
jgi:hypothetical protein